MSILKDLINEVILKKQSPNYDVPTFNGGTFSDALKSAQAQSRTNQAANNSPNAAATQQPDDSGKTLNPLTGGEQPLMPNGDSQPSTASWRDRVSLDPPRPEMASRINNLDISNQPLPVERTGSGSGIQYTPPNTSDNYREMNPRNLAEDNVNSILNEKPTNKNHGVKGTLKELAENFLANMGKAPQGSGFGGLLGAGLGGAAVGAVDRTQNEQRDKNRRLGGAMQKLQIQQGIDDANLAMRAKQAGIDNLNHDNNAQDQKEKDARDLAQGKQTDSRRAAWFKTRKFFDPAKATDADRREAAQFNETPESIGKYDFTNPQVRESGGVKYRLNPNTNAWEDTGIPKDGSKAIVDYTVTDPSTGVESTYSTTSENAARLKNSLATSGMQISAAKERQQSQQKFQAGQNQERLQNATERVDKQIKAADDKQKTQLLNSSLSRWQQTFSKTNFRQPNQDEIDQATQNIRKTIYGQ